ncbi:MAG: hypothetical protein AAGF76_05275 [Pseudomonadota bacterium]
MPLSPFSNNATATLRVTDQTDATALKNFLAKAEDGEKVFARKSNGQTVLYISDKASRSGLSLDKFRVFKNFSDRHVMARTAMETILKNTANAKIQVDATKASNVNSADFYKDWHTGLLESAVEDQFDKAEGANGQTGLSATLASRLARVVESTVARAQWIDERLAQYPSAARTLPPSTSRVLEETTKLGDHDYPSFEIGGRTFEPEEVVGTGSFGKAVRYRHEASGETRIIKLHKQFDADVPGGLNGHRKEAIHELNAGTKYAAGRENVLGFTDHVEMPNGSIALIGDDGANGNLRQFAERMAELHEDGTIGDHERRLITLTLTADIANGVASMQAAGAVHGDMKPANQVIDATGNGNLIDLGFAEDGPKVSRIKGQHLLSNAAYNAPETQALRGKPRPPAPDRNEILTELNELIGMTSYAPSVQPTFDHLRRLGGDLFTRAAMIDHVDEHGIDGRADVWGVGLTTFALFHGGDFPVDNRLQRRAEEIKGADATLPDNVVRERALADITAQKAQATNNPYSHGVNFDGGSLHGNAGYVDPTGDPWIDAVLDKTLSANPDRRIAASDISNHQAMSYAAQGDRQAVGSPEVRALIVAIASGDAGEIAEARAALKLAFDEPEPEVLQEQIRAMQPAPPPYRSSMEDYPMPLPGPPPGPPPGTPLPLGPELKPITVSTLSLE